MSDLNRTRKGRARKNVAAVVSAVALACGTTAVVPTAAPKFAAVADAQDASPLSADPFNVDLSVENLDPNNFNYILKFDAKPRKELTPAGTPSPAILHEFRVGIETDENTELIREPSAEDFVWASGKTRNIVRVEKEKNGNRYLIVFGDQATDRQGNPLFYDDGTPQYGVPEGDYPLSASFPARLTANAGAETFKAWADASARLGSSGDWTELYKTIQYDENDLGLQFHTPAYEDANPKPVCPPDPNPNDDQPGPQSRAEQWTIAELQGTGYGQQLADVFLGVPPGSDFRLVEAEPDPDLVPELKRQGYVFGKGWSVRITDPDGKVITQEVMDKTKVKVNNPDNSVVPNRPYEGAGYNGNVQPRWLTAFQWPLKDPVEVVDDSEVWLRAGTKFEIHQFIESPGCQIQPASQVASHFVGATIQRSVRAEDNVDFSFPFIGDRVWVDTNANGIQDDDEQTNVPGVKVTVSRDGEEDRVTTTDENGQWRINNLTPKAEYTVKFELPTEGEFKDYTATKTEVGRDAEKDSNGLTFKTKPVPAEGDLSYDLGISTRLPSVTASGSMRTATASRMPRRRTWRV